MGRFHLFPHDALELTVVLKFVCRAHAGVSIKFAFCQLAQFRKQHFIHIVKDELHIGFAVHFVCCFKVGIEPVTVAVRQNGNGGFRPVEVKLELVAVLHVKRRAQSLAFQKKDRLAVNKNRIVHAGVLIFADGG